MSTPPLTLEGTNNIPQQAFEQWNDPHGNPLVRINRDGTLFVQGLAFQDQSVQLTGAVPIIQASGQFVHTSAPHMITFTSPLTEMYELSIYIVSDGNGAGGQTVTATITYTDPSNTAPAGLTQTVNGNDTQAMFATVPLLVKAGTPIAISVAFDGAYTFSYNVSMRLVVLPQLVTA